MMSDAASRRIKCASPIPVARFRPTATPIKPQARPARWPASPDRFQRRNNQREAHITPHGARFPLILAGAVALIAIACGGGDDPGPTPAPIAQSAPATSSTAAAVPTATVTPPATSAGLSSPAPTPGPDASIPGRIAYVTPRFEIFTVSPDGSNPVRVSPATTGTNLATADNLYIWPLWFPAGDRLLFSRIQPPDQFGSRVALVSAAADGSDLNPVVVYEDDPLTNGIGGSAPHYTAFSPDGRGLAAIVGSQGGLVLTVFDATRPGSRGADLVTGAPLYFDWSRDSTTLVVHQGERLLTFNNAIEGGSADTEQTAPTSFFAPAMSPAADRAAVVMELPAGPELRLLGQDEGFVTETPAGAMFAWSPDGSRLALLRQTNPGALFGLFNELAIIEISADGIRSERILQSNRLMRSIWWAPDGQKLALALVDLDDSRRTRWEIIDVVAGGSVHIATMILSPEFDFIQTFAGQYERSHNFWSPDSRYLVLAGSLEGPAAIAADAAAPGEAAIWVVAIDGATPARTLGPGSLAFWSP